MATNRYVLGSDQDADSAKKIEDEIPPFVSPPITSPMTSPYSLGPAPYALSYRGAFSSSLLSRKSEDHHHEPSSIGSGLASPLSAVDDTYTAYRRRSSIQKPEVHDLRAVHKDGDKVGGGVTRAFSVYPQIPELREKELRSAPLIELALETMSRFKLHDVNVNLLYFVRETILFYCNHSVLSIRKQVMFERDVRLCVGG